MPRYIDADEALRQLENNRKDNPCQAPYRGIWDRASKNAIDTIEAIPTADVVERKHGSNITKNHPVDEFVCSECGFITRECHRIEIDEEYGDETCFEFEYRFCPRCGADMRGGDKE